MSRNSNAVTPIHSRASSPAPGRSNNTASPISVTQAWGARPKASMASLFAQPLPLGKLILLDHYSNTFVDAMQIPNLVRNLRKHVRVFQRHGAALYIKGLTANLRKFPSLPNSDVDFYACFESHVDVSATLSTIRRQFPKFIICKQDGHGNLELSLRIMHKKTKMLFKIDVEAGVLAPEEYIQKSSFSLSNLHCRFLLLTVEAQTLTLGKQVISRAEDIICENLVFQISPDKSIRERLCQIFLIVKAASKLQTKTKVDNLFGLFLMFNRLIKETAGLDKGMFFRGISKIYSCIEKSMIYSSMILTYLTAQSTHSWTHLFAQFYKDVSSLIYIQQIGGNASDDLQARVKNIIAMDQIKPSSLKAGASIFVPGEELTPSSTQTVAIAT